VGRPDEPHRQVGAPGGRAGGGLVGVGDSDVAAVGEALAGYENLLLIARLLDLSRIGPAAGGFIATVFWVVALLGCCRGT
jgi:hypothetical protein